MKVVIEAPLEIMQYQDMVEARKSNNRQTTINLHFPSGHCNHSLDPSPFSKVMADSLNQMFGKQHYQQ